MPRRAWKLVGMTKMRHIDHYGSGIVFAAKAADSLCMCIHAYRRLAWTYACTYTKAADALERATDDAWVERMREREAKLQNELRSVERALRTCVHVHMGTCA